MNQGWERSDLSGRVAVVAGASRGVGRGVAEVLGECGAFVYVTGRSTRASPDVDPERTVEAVAEAIVREGGGAEAVVCDHKLDADVRRVFERVRAQHGGLDILVNNQVGWSDTPLADGFARRRLWQRPLSWWDDNFDAGVRGHVVNCQYGIPLMLGRPGAIAMFTSERAADSASDAWDAVLDLRATLTLRLVELLGSQLRDEEIAAVLLYPGWTRTEDQVDAIERGELPPTVRSREEYFEKTVSPRYSGRAAAKLAADPRALELTGSLVTAFELAARYDFDDVDGRRPDPS